jgi:hypothetical protein
VVTQEQLNKLSNEFTSTFTYVGEGLLINCLRTSELPAVSNLIKKHIPKVKKVSFEATIELGPGYGPYLILLEFEHE